MLSLHKFLFEMLGRRILRIKVFKTIYSFAENPGMSLADAKSQLKASCESTRDLYLFLLSIVGPLTAEAESRIEAARSKFNPSEEEKNPNLKFVHNRIAPLLGEDPDFEKALKRIPEIRAEFHADVKVSGKATDFNQNLEAAERVADYLEFAELLTRDALHREESCGGHFREESQTAEGEAKRDDARFCYVGAWSYQGEGAQPELLKEPLAFENVPLATRSYK